MRAGEGHRCVDGGSACAVLSMHMRHQATPMHCRQRGRWMTRRVLLTLVSLHGLY